MILLLGLSACGTGGGGTEGSASPVRSLTIDPPSATVETTPDAAGTVQFTAIATFEDGTTAPLEELVSWSLSNTSAGDVADDGFFTAATTNGAVSTLTASHNGIVAEADITVVWSSEGGDDTTDPTAFEGTPAGTVEWLYPPDGVAVPRNVPSLTFMWTGVTGATSYRLSLTTATTRMTVVTTGTRWTVEGADWAAVAATNAGGEVAVDVRALVDGQPYASETRTVTVNRLDAQGSIYYWSTTDAGIVRVPIGADEPEVFYAPPSQSPMCVACHVVRGDRMGVTYQEGASFYVGITDISEGSPVELTNMTTPGYYNTMNPEGTRMISTSADGGLNLWDAETGQFLRAIDTQGYRLTQPDWSPMGDVLAAVASDHLFGDNNFSDGRIVVATIDDDGNLGTITEVHAGPELGEDRYSSFYPSISPDGEWIAFNKGSGSSYNNEGAALWLVSVNGGDAIELANANLGPDLYNSWPHWGPLPDDDIFWLTFSSHRDYGDLVTDGRPQIWVAAFHPERAEAGVDPSTPAFWLPNQDIETSNHTTFWGP